MTAASNINHKELPCTCWLFFTGAALAVFLGIHFPCPSVLPALLPYLLFLVLSCTMIGIDLKPCFKDPRHLESLFLFSAINFITTPLSASIYAYWLFKGATPDYAAGFILIAMAPCCRMGPFQAGLKDLDATSSLVPINILWTLVVAPLMMWLIAAPFVELRLLPLFSYMLIIVMGPLLAGQFIRKLLQHQMGQTAFTISFSPKLRRMALWGSFLIIIIISYSQASFILANLKMVSLTALGYISFYPMLGAITLIFSRCAGIGFKETMAILCTGAEKNHILSITFAALCFGTNMAVLPAVVAFMLQKPMMFLLLKGSNRISSYLKQP